MAPPLTGYLNGEDVPRRLRYSLQHVATTGPQVPRPITTTRCTQPEREQILDFRFPYPDARWCFTSVKHPCFRRRKALSGRDLRVLKPGGRCLCTYFLLNDESLAHIAEGKSTTSSMRDRVTDNPQEAARRSNRLCRRPSSGMPI